MMDLYGVGDHGGGPTRTMLDEGEHWMEPDKVVPKEEFGTAQAFFSKVETQVASESPQWTYVSLAKGDRALAAPAAGQISIPTWKDELYLEYHRGVFTTQADQKRNMRESEEWMLNAEKVASLAWLDGMAYPGKQLTAAWKLVLFNQFHDLAAGSGIGVIYRDAQKDYTQVHWSADEVSRGALATVAAHAETRVRSGVPVLVFNPLAWTRGGSVEVSVQMPAAGDGEVTVLDAQEQVVPSEVLARDAATHTLRLLVRAAAVPSMGFAVLHVVEGGKVFFERPDGQWTDA